MPAPSLIGGTVFDGLGKLTSGPLGVCRIGFNGWDLGKTNAETMLAHEEDIKDILYQQSGTKPGDHVRTGEEYILTATFAEINTGILDQVIDSYASAQVAGSNIDSATVGRNMFASMRAGAAALKIGACDANGNWTGVLQDTMAFYEAIPFAKGGILNWVADAQRKLPVQFRIKFHTFNTGESVTKYGAFGYLGDPTLEDVPAVTWTDRAGPQLVSAAVASATTLTLTFDKNVAIQGTFVSGWYACDVAGVIKLGVSVAITNKVATVTFAASTFATGNTVKTFVTKNALQDTASSPNKYGGVYGQATTNPL